jgi:predicted nucleic acid-binding protein
VSLSPQTVQKAKVLAAKRSTSISGLVAEQIEALVDADEAHDIDAEQKHEIAKEVLQDLWANRSGFLSPQVLQEFYVNVTRKRSKLLVKTSARAVVDKYAIWCVDTTSAEIAVAFRIEDEARIGFWDALIYASALRAGAEQIISEDLNAGQKIAGIRVVNPFARLKLK